MGKKQRSRNEEYNSWNEKNTLEEINIRSGEAEDGDSDLEDKVSENIQSEKQKGKEFLNNENSLDLAMWLSSLEWHPMHQKIAGLTPSGAQA